jgi:hypothetical protein
MPPFQSCWEMGLLSIILQNCEVKIKVELEVQFIIILMSKSFAKRVTYVPLMPVSSPDKVLWVY